MLDSNHIINFLMISWKNNRMECIKYIVLNCKFDKLFSSQSQNILTIV